MRVSQSIWLEYTKILRGLNETAVAKVKGYLSKHKISSDADFRALIEYAHAVATKYGEGSAALAGEMYNKIALAEGKVIAGAEAAETATMPEVAKAVTGTMEAGNDDLVANSVGRLVKMAGADTVIKNAVRDHAEFAWIPQGAETCAFCMTLASEGWQPASKVAINGGHATHIHANCDCMYAIRFRNDTSYDGYDPGRYKRIYNNAEGNTSREKINSIRRMLYAQNKEDAGE